MSAYLPCCMDMIKFTAMPSSIFPQEVHVYGGNVVNPYNYIYTFIWMRMLWKVLYTCMYRE